MAKIFITGSSDGLGLMAAKLLAQNHEVAMHARNETRAIEAMREVPNALKVLIADLSSIEATKKLAAAVNALGTFDAIIHNAAVYKIPEAARSHDGFPLTFAVNTLAPYLLTCLIGKPKRLVYMSSDMHFQGNPKLHELTNGSFDSSYSDTKLHDLMLALAVARMWPDVFSNAVHPGWVPTKMGGSGAPDDLQKGFETQGWLATSDETSARVSGHYFHHKKQVAFLPVAANVLVQEKLLEICESLSGVAFPIKK